MQGYQISIEPTGESSKKRLGLVIKKEKPEITTFLIKEGKIEEKKGYSSLLREKEYISFFLSPQEEISWEEVDKKARTINKKLNDETVLTPQRIALIAGIFIVLHYKKETKEKKILKNIYDTNLERLDEIIKSNFADDMKQILLGEFKDNETEEATEKIEVAKRVIE